MTGFFASPAFTLLHVVISLIGIAAGAIVLRAMLGNRPLGSVNQLFLVTTIVTTLTGFLFPLKGFDPAIGVGIVSVITLCIAVVSLYRGRLLGFARPAYVVSAVFALYLNIFVAIVQAFQKIPLLGATDPAHPPPAFLVVQAVASIMFIGLGVIATRRFRPMTP